MNLSTTLTPEALARLRMEAALKAITPSEIMRQRLQQPREAAAPIVRKSVELQVDDRLHAALKAEAKAEGISMKELVQSILERE